MEKQEVVVSFKTEKRQITMYFTDNDGELDMNMVITPELKENEPQDLQLSLVSLFMQMLQTNTEENKDENESETQIIFN